MEYLAAFQFFFVNPSKNCAKSSTIYQKTWTIFDEFWTVFQKNIRTVSPVFWTEKNSTKVWNGSLCASAQVLKLENLEKGYAKYKTNSNNFSKLQKTLTNSNNWWNVGGTSNARRRWLHTLKAMTKLKTCVSVWLYVKES